MIHGRPNPVSTPAEFSIRGAANNSFHHNNNYVAATGDDDGGQNAISCWDPATTQTFDEILSFLSPLDAAQSVGGTNTAAPGNVARKPDNFW